MKKLTISVLFVLFSGLLFAQEAPTWESLADQKEKSDSEVSNPKKSESYKTWLKRADIFFDIHTFETAGLYAGMQAKPTNENPFNNLERLFGKPGKILTADDNAEIWVYTRKNVTVKNGAVESWEQTEFIDEQAITISAEALLKAVSLDEKGTLKDKTTTKDKAQIIKNTIINDGIAEFKKYNNDLEKNGSLTENGKRYLDKAYNLMAFGYKLFDLPKNETDTAFKAEQVEFFMGLLAFNNEKYDIAEKHFSACIDKKYGEGSPYHYLAESFAKTGDSTKFISTVKKGFEAYPDEEQLIIDLINYYMSKNKTNEAIEYIDIAIKNNPENPSYYSAKASIYDNGTDALLKKYEEFMEQASEYKKEAFRDRSIPAKRAEAENKRDAELEKAMNVVSQIKKDLDFAVEYYEKALEINPKFFNAAYNIGRVYLKHNERDLKHADYILKIYIDKDFKKSEQYEKIAEEELKTAAEKFEIAYNIDTGDIDTLKVLKRIYYRLHDEANLARVEELLKK